MVPRMVKCSAFIFAATDVCKKLNFRYIFTTSKLKARSTVKAEEIKKFEDKSGEWWDGKAYATLHLFNGARVPLIRDGILCTAKVNRNVSKPLEGYSILDVGCGGGILSEPLARLGAKVTGLDPGAQNIQAAAEHASKDPEIKENLTYICDTVENLTASDNRYDAVVASEVVEHVNDVSTFVHSCVELTKTNGSVFFTTINRTITSYFLTILLAEYVLHYIPKGTHDWNMFVKPQDLIEMMESLNCRVVSNEGILYNPVTKKFSLCKSSANMYSVHAVKL